MELKAIAEALVAHCRANTTYQGLDELYAEDAESIEAFPGPDGSSPISKGRGAIRGKHEWWDSAFDVHSAIADGPYLHGPNRFAVIFEIDATETQSGQRSQMKEVGIYTVEEGKIVREEFFYTPASG